MFKRSAVVIAGAAGAGALLVAPGARPQAHWGYEGTHGPKHWGSLDPGFAVCSNGRGAQRHPRGSRASAPTATRGSAALRAAGAGLKTGVPAVLRFCASSDARFRWAARSGCRFTTGTAARRAAAGKTPNNGMVLVSARPPVGVGIARRASERRERSLCSVLYIEHSSRVYSILHTVCHQNATPPSRSRPSPCSASSALISGTPAGAAASPRR